MGKIKKQKMLDMINTALTPNVLVEARRNAIELARKEMEQIITVGRKYIKIQIK